jgi:hypothetical protein
MGCKGTHVFGWRRIGVASLVLAVAAAGGALAWSAWPKNSTTGREAVSSDFKVVLPKEPRGVDKRGLTILDANTNLPDGSIIDLYHFSANIESPARTTVRDGRIKIRVANHLCHDTEVGLIGTGVRVTVALRPEYRDPFGVPGASPLPPITQPPHVQKVLGSRLERLAGEQVRKVDHERYLEASKTYELPSETCMSKVVYSAAGDFDQIPVRKKVSLDPGPFPRPPFTWCPDVLDALPVEAGGSLDAGRVARTFDLALRSSDGEPLAELADPSVQSVDHGWTSTGSTDPQVANHAASGFHIPAVPAGCGSLVALRTRGVVLSAYGVFPAPQGGRESGERIAQSTTYLLVLRSEGWRVWASLPGSG